MDSEELEFVSKYAQVIDSIKAIECMAHCSAVKRDWSHENSQQFCIRGTRIFLRASKIVYLRQNGPESGISLRWFLKKKHSKQFLNLSFEEVIDSKLVGNKARTDLLFNLEIFSGNGGH